MIQEQTQHSMDIDNCVQLCEKYLGAIEKQNDSIILVLDDDKIWLDIVKSTINDDQNVVTISDIEVFRAFIIENGTKKMYLDINMGPVNGIELAEELKLDRSFGELIFTSSEIPNESDMARIEALGAPFIHKDDLLERIKRKQGQ